MPLSGCDEEGNVDWKAVEDLIAWLLGKTGWLADKEDDGKVPDVVPNDGDDTNLPTKVDLSAYFPPIGDQGSYGTCVVWATGYNLKTALNAKQKAWTASNLSSKSNQTSPADLWYAISTSDKNTNCNGTNFEPSLSVLQTYGAANMETVPYSSMNCSAKATYDSSNKLQQFRQIAYKDISGGGNDKGMTVENFKAYLRDGKPIAFGAQLGERFMAWNSSAVLSSDTKDYKGQHAYHALALVGYDDNQGTKGAFHVRNSWGTGWGDNGSIWVDYDFFVNQFCFSAYIADNAGTVSSAPKRAKSNLSVSASDFENNSVKV
ncbi:hypothetical protein FACS189434_14580 [Bacteroidia bacterium]|nr:hypothetical protein FACS189434_14580 [Bacteroidia bacterium]